MHGYLFFFFQAEDGIRDLTVTGVQTCALPIYYLLLVLAQQLRRGVHRLEVYERRCGDGRMAPWREEGDRPERERVEAHGIGRACADADAPVVPIDLARVDAEQRAAHRLGNGGGCQPDVVGLRGVDAHRHLSRGLAHAAEEILQALDARHSGVEPRPVGLGGGQVGAEELDLHRAGIAGEVVDDVGEDLHELDPHARQRGTRLLPYLVDDVADRPVALALRLEPDDVVAAVLQRREEAELSAGPPTGPSHLRDPREDTVDHAQLAIGLRQRRAAPGPE